MIKIKIKIKQKEEIPKFLNKRFKVPGSSTIYTFLEYDKITDSYFRDNGIRSSSKEQKKEKWSFGSYATKEIEEFISLNKWKLLKNN